MLHSGCILSLADTSTTSTHVEKLIELKPGACMSPPKVPCQLPCTAHQACRTGAVQQFTSGSQGSDGCPADMWTFSPTQTAQAARPGACSPAPTGGSGCTPQAARGPAAWPIWRRGPPRPSWLLRPPSGSWCPASVGGTFWGSKMGAPAPASASGRADGCVEPPGFILKETSCSSACKR